MTSDINSETSRLIAAAHRAVLEQTKRNEFDPTPYERATELLESLPSADFVDDRVQLALDITIATRGDYRPDLSRRALYAAFPDGAAVTDLRLKRKWFTFTGVIESRWGNVERALKYKLIALNLCEQLKDSFGLCAEWTNFSSLASGAGLYQDAERYATVVIETAGDNDSRWLDVRGSALLSRANASMHLGRYATAESDVLLSLMAATHPDTASVRYRVFMAQYLFAEIQIERGDLSAARSALYAASTWANACGIPRYILQIERVRARLSAREGSLEQANASLKGLLGRAHKLEAEFGGTADDDVVLDVLHTLERVHRDHHDIATADEWLEAIGQKLRINVTNMLDAVADKPPLADLSMTVTRTAAIDKYLETRSVPRQHVPRTDSSWTYVIGLAATAIGAEDSTKEHGVRVARLASLIAQELNLSEDMLRGIEAGCLVHDVGKVSVPAQILVKGTSLDEVESRLYDAHPDVGANLLERMRHPAQRVVLNVVRFHHHWYDGQQTDSSLRGGAIPLEARIAAVCDEYDALVTGRPRSVAVGGNEALSRIFAQRSLKFDPHIVEVFVEIVRRLQRLHPDLQTYLSEEADDMEYFAVQRTLKRAADRALAHG